MLILLALAIQAASPVTASKEINCPVAEYGLVPEKLSAFGDESSSQTDKDLAKEAVRDALVKCAASHKWSANRTAAAIMHVVTEVQVLGARKKYVSLGSRAIAYDKLYGYFQTLSFEDRVAMVTEDSAAADKLRAFLAKSGFRFDGNGTEDDGVMTGTTGDVFAGWIMRDEAEAAFAEDRPMRGLDLGER
jgi:hypothetical protein